MKEIEKPQQTELDYKQYLVIIRRRKSLIQEASLLDDSLNNEYIRLTEIEVSIRKILRDELPGLRDQADQADPSGPKRTQADPSGPSFEKGSDG